MLRNKVFKVNFAADILNLCFSFISEFIPDGNKLISENAVELDFIGKKLTVVSDFFFKRFELLNKLLSVKPLKSFEPHIKDCLSLNIIKTEAFHKSYLCIVIACADNMDYFVDIILSYDKTFEQVSSFKSLLQIKLCSSADNLLLI